MKISYLLLGVILIASNSFAQLSVSTFLTNATVQNNEQIEALKKLPFDETRIVEVKSIQPSAGGLLTYELIEVTEGEAEPYFIPLCTELGQPYFLKNGILGAGRYMSGERELIYWDGNEVVLIDLNTHGSSNPRLQVVNGVVHILAEEGAGYRMFTFDEMNKGVVETAYYDYVEPSAFVASYSGDLLYHQSIPHGGGVKHELKFVFEGQGTSGWLQDAGIVDDGSAGYYSNYNFSEPIYKNGELFLLERFYNTVGDPTCRFRVYRVHDQSCSYLWEEVIFELDQVYADVAELFVWNGDLYFYSNNSGSLYVSSNWHDFTIAGIQNSGTFIDHHVSKNGKLYLEQYDSTLDETVIYEFDGTNFIPRVSGNHQHILNEFDNKLYIYDYGAGAELSKITVLDAIWNQVEELEIDFAPMAQLSNSSLMYQGKFTFLYDQNPMKVLQLEGATLNLEALEHDAFEIYPNPVVTGTPIFIPTEKSEPVQIYSASGELVFSAIVQPGNAQIDLSDLKAGMYLVMRTSEVTKLIVTN